MQCPEFDDLNASIIELKTELEALSRPKGLPPPGEKLKLVPEATSRAVQKQVQSDKNKPPSGSQPDTAAEYKAPDKNKAQDSEAIVQQPETTSEDTKSLVKSDCLSLDHVVSPWPKISAQKGWGTHILCRVTPNIWLINTDDTLCFPTTIQRGCKDLHISLA